MEKRPGLFLSLTIGILTAFGPFLTDFYMPALPEMVEALKTDEAAVQMSLTACMVGLALGQLIIGPLSDKYGRKSLLIGSLALFLVASVFCVVASNITMFNIARVFQGLGGAGGIVLSKSISTDLFTGNALTKFLAVLSMINAVTSLAAPLVGGALLLVMYWQSIFIVCAGIGLMLIVMCAFVPESLPKDKRSDVSVVKSFGGLFKVFESRTFFYSTLVLMTMYFLFFCIVSSSTFILQTTYGMSSTLYAVVFGAGLLVIGFGAALCPRFQTQVRALRTGVLLIAVSAIATVVSLLVLRNVYCIIASYVLAFFSFGMMQTLATTLGLDAGRKRAGSSSATLGACSFIAGAIAPPLISLGGNLESGSCIGIGLSTALALVFVMKLTRLPSVRAGF